MNAPLILVIEDTLANLELISDLLELSGCRVISATTAEAGIDLARHQKPELILMDISLPGMDGLEATRLLKADKLTEAIPVIALTAHAMRGDDEEARKAGCIAYISKPIDTRNFPGQIADFLATKTNEGGQFQ